MNANVPGGLQLSPTEDASPQTIACPTCGARIDALTAQAPATHAFRCGCPATTLDLATAVLMGERR